MPLVLETPTKLRLPAAWEGSRLEQELGDRLGYEDLRVTHDWRRHRKMQRAADQGRRVWYVEQHGREALDALVAQLEAQRSKTCLFKDEHGLWTYSGLAPQITAWTGEAAQLWYRPPPPQVVAWENRPPHELRPYQVASVAALTERVLCQGPVAVELATGLGKSLIITHLLKRLGLGAVVLAPTLSIAEQLLKDLTRAFGRRQVGRFFGGKKEATKRFVVAVSKSLTTLPDEAPLWAALRAKSVLVGDEAHMLPAETLRRVVLGQLGQLPYRFFLSGTQLRTDGLQTVLDGIVGEILVRMTVQEGVAAGYLAPLRFFQFEVGSDRAFSSDDVLRMNRVHLHENPRVYRHAAGQVRWAQRRGRRPLVMVEEVTQFQHFFDAYVAAGGDPGGVGFAHGGLNKSHKGDAALNKPPLVPAAFWKSDPNELVEAFDAGRLDVLVGTGCIGMGTDIKSTGLIVDIVGLAPEARFRQRAGRGVRLFAGKKDCIYSDYSIWDVEKLAKQAKERRRIMESIMPGVQTVRV